MRRLTKSRGSILIWTLLLGISLATVFFFFSMRLNFIVASQRETIRYQNARLYFESYIAYIQSLDVADLVSLRGNIDFDGITVTLTNETDEIVGILDAGQSTTFEIAGDDTKKVKIEWDHCDDEDEVEIVEITPSVAFFETNCPGYPFDYDDVAESTAPSFTLKATSAPVKYRVMTMNEATVLYDNKWHLDLELAINFRKKLTTSIAFIPSP